MAYFRCGQGAGGNELKILITTTDTSLYGQTITISKDGSTVGTTTFDNTGNAEYTVDEAGLYTVSCGGASESVLVEDEYEVSLSAIPDGSTVTPVNDIQTWLHCAGIFNKTTYTTISDVLADTTTLLALINSQNAIDYMVRSHDWCDDVCADATAMTYIGANDYAADTLLADSNEGLVPIMTSDNTPSGECIGSDHTTGYDAFKAFDRNSVTIWNSNGTGTTEYAKWLGYHFTSPVCVRKIMIRGDASYYLDLPKTFKAQTSDDGVTWTDVDGAVFTTANDSTASEQYFEFENTTVAPYFRVDLGISWRNKYNNYVIAELQFYAKDGSWLESICNSTYFESVLNVKVPTMTSNTTPSGECFGQSASSTGPLYYAFDGNDATTCYQSQGIGRTIGYHFQTSICVYKAYQKSTSGESQIKVQSSDDGSTYIDMGDGQNRASVNTFIFSDSTPHAYWRMYAFGTASGNSYVNTIQFYGRAAS